MAKKIEVKKIRPSEAVSSMSEFNDKVLMLVQACDFLLRHGAIDEKMKSSLENPMNEVKSFFDTKS